MITYQTYREASVFQSGGATETFSGSTALFGGSVETESGGITTTYDGGGTTTFFDGGESQVEGFSYSFDGTSSTTFQQFVEFSSISTFATTIQVNTSSTYEVNTTVITSSSTSFALGTTTASAPFTTTTEAIVTVTDIVDTAFNSFTTSAEYTSTSFYSTSSAIGSPVDLGVVIIAEPGEWLWSITATAGFGDVCNTDFNPVTAIAESFTAATIWQTATAVAQDPSPYNVRNGIAESITITNDDSSTVFTVENISYGDTTSYAVTTGSFLSAGTFPSFYSQTSITFSTTSAGFIGGSFVAFEGLSQSTTFTQEYLAATSTLVPVTEKDGVTLATLATTVQTTTTYTAQTSVVGYIGEDIVDSSGFGGIDAVTQKATNLYYIYIGTVNNLNPGGGYSVYEPIPFAGGMESPGSMGQLDSPGTNIAIDPAIYYPFLSSVLENVLVPIPLNTSAVNSDTSWRYSWNDYELSYTSYSTYTSLAGTSTVTNTHSSSSSFESLLIEGGGLGTFYKSTLNDLAPFGGYAPYTSQSLIAQFTPGFYAQTTIDGTSSATETFLLQNFTTTAGAGVMTICEVLPVFVTSTYLADYGQFPQILSFGR